MFEGWVRMPQWWEGVLQHDSGTEFRPDEVKYHRDEPQSSNDHEPQHLYWKCTGHETFIFFKNVWETASAHQLLQLVHCGRDPGVGAVRLLEDRGQAQGVAFLVEV